MKHGPRRNRLAAVLLLPGLAAACMTTGQPSGDGDAGRLPPLVAAQPGPDGVLCSATVDGGTVTVLAGFDRSRASGCRIGADGVIEVLILPETRPINDSPWYAFRITTEVARPVSVVLRYRDGTHRYAPKVTRDGVSWSLVDPARVVVAADESSAQIALDLPAGVTTVAAQPFETAAQSLARWDAFVADGRLTRWNFGTSVRGVPLVALATPGAGAGHTLVLVGRQHPAETTGADAFDAFVARLLEDDPLATAFRSRVALLLVPVMNPDGLTAGHWRTNANGVDLNRDWGIWAQPETRAAGLLIEQTHRTRPLIGLIDFHSTRRDLIYAMPAEDPLFPPGLAEDWFARWQAVAGAAAPPIQRRFDDDQMNSKTWSRTRFGLSGVTYEVGDNTPLPTVRANARIAAETYMQAVLALTPEQLTPQSAPAGS